MKPITIFVNDSAINQALNEIETLVNNAEIAAQNLRSLGVDPEHAVDAMAGNREPIKQAYIDAELVKLQPSIALLGDGSYLIDIAKQKIIADADALVEKVRERVRLVDYREHSYLLYLSCIDGKWQPKKGCKQELEKAQSIILSTEQEISEYNEIKTLVDGLNKYCKSTNLLAGVGLIARYNHTDNTFELSPRRFDKKNILPSYF